MRDDDTKLLTHVTAAARCGRLYSRKARRTSKPQVAWQVSSMADCQRLCRFLADSMVMSKKSLEFEVWRRAVSVWTSKTAHRCDEMDGLAAELAVLRDPTRPA